MFIAALLLAAPLNHFFVVPDAETFDAMKASAFLREQFGVYEERTTVRNDTSYTGIYFYGRDTYFEFLPPSQERREGTAGVAFGIETEGGSGPVAQSLTKLGAKPVRDFVVTRKLDDTDVPWFRMVGVETPGDAPFASWTMEYDKAFLARWHAELPPASRAITRANVLSRYAEKLGQAKDRDARLLRDVTALTLALAEPEREAFSKQLEACGYAVERSGDGFVARGTTTFTVRAAQPGEPGIVEAVFAVKAGVPVPAELRIGASVLTFAGDGSARWRFSATAR